MDLLIWGGPVFAPGSSPYPRGDVGKVQWENPTEIMTVSGDGSSHFANVAAQFLDANGRILPGLLASKGKRLDAYKSIAIAGFSAFHGLAAQLLKTDGDIIDAAVLLDSCFSASPGYEGKQGYVSFGKLAVAGERLMVMTSSNGRNSPPLPPSTSGSECAFRSFDDATGGVYEHFDVPSPLPPIPADSTTGRALKSGGLYLLDYGPQFLHGQHINELSVDVLQTFLVPYMGGDRGLVESSSGALWKTAAYAVGLSGVALALYLLTRTGTRK